MTIERCGRYKLCENLPVRGSFSICTIPSGTEFEVTQVDHVCHKVYSPQFGDWVYWDIFALPVI